MEKTIWLILVILIYSCNASDNKNDETKVKKETLNEYNLLIGDIAEYYGGECEIWEEFTSDSETLVVELIGSGISEERVKISSSRIAFLTFKEVSQYFDYYKVNIDNREFVYSHEILIEIGRSDSLRKEIVNLIKDKQFEKLYSFFIEDNPYEISDSNLIADIEIAESQLPDVLGESLIGFDVFPNEDIRVYGLINRGEISTNLTIEIRKIGNELYITLIDYKLQIVG